MKLKDAISAAATLYQQHQNLVGRAKAIANGVGRSANYGKKAVQGLKAGEGVGTAEGALAANPTGTWNLFGKAKVVGGVVGAAASVVSVPAQLVKAGQQTHAALESGKREDIVAATRGTLQTVRGGVNSASGALETAVTVVKLRSSYTAALKAFNAAVPDASEAVARAVARSAMGSVFEGASRQVVRSAAVGAAKEAAHAEGAVVRGVAGSATRAATNAAIRSGARVAAGAAAEAGARVSVGSLGRAAVRFAPGANIALAAIDTAAAATTLADPKASRGARVSACITAAGSVASATNIPIVSQVGAGVATVSSLVSAFL